MPETDAAARAQNIAAAKRLLRVTRLGALATLFEGGAPLATLVTLASDHDGAPLLLMSDLSQHSKNLKADPRAGLLLALPASRGDPLNSPRLSLSGRLARLAAPHARRRFLSTHPKAKLYAGFADFSIYRLDVEAVHFNGGFGRAAPMAPADILTSLDGAQALLEAEGAMLEALDADRPALARLAPAHGAKPRRWRAIGLDPDGLDLALGALAERITFAAPALTPQAWRSAADAISRSGAL